MSYSSPVPHPPHPPRAGTPDQVGRLLRKRRLPQAGAVRLRHSSSNSAWPHTADGDHSPYLASRLPSPWLRRILPLTFLLLSFGIHPSALAHPADQSELRARPKPHQLELRFTFNILTLTRFVSIDTDGDGRISMAELKAAHPRIASYLNQHVKIEINQQKATLGSGVRFEALWPDAEKTLPMTEVEYAARNVDVTFSQTIVGKRLEDFWLGFEIFEQTGPMQTIRGVFEQDGKIEEVPFSVQEPEYLYDTGYADDPFEQEEENKAARLSAQPSLSSSPPSASGVSMTSPGVRLGSAPTEPAASSPSSSSPLVAAPALAAHPSAALASALEPKTTEDAPSDQRWWMIRVGVIMILLVVGRKLQLSARSRLASPRRRRPRRQ